MDTHIPELQQLLEHEKPNYGDVLVWLQGDQYDRGKKVVELYEKGYAPYILLTGNNILVGKGTRSEEENISLDHMKKWLEKQGVEAEKIMVDDEALNTREQAQHVIDLAIRKQWNTIILVSSIHYHLRAFLTFLKYRQERGWNGKILNQMITLDWDDVPSGRVKSAREYFIEEVEKIYQYRDHVALPEQGIHYLKSNS